MEKKYDDRGTIRDRKGGRRREGVSLGRQRGSRIKKKHERERETEGVREG